MSTPVVELLSDPKKWAKGFYAYNNRHETVDAESEDAVCWCIVGAIRRCYRDALPCGRAIDRIVSVLGFTNSCDLAIWNDSPSRQHEEVLAACEKARI